MRPAHLNFVRHTNLLMFSTFLWTIFNLFGNLHLVNSICGKVTLQRKVSVIFFFLTSTPDFDLFSAIMLGAFIVNADSFDKTDSSRFGNTTAFTGESSKRVPSSWVIMDFFLSNSVRQFIVCGSSLGSFGISFMRDGLQPLLFIMPWMLVWALDFVILRRKTIGRSCSPSVTCSLAALSYLVAWVCLLQRSFSPE